MWIGIPARVVVVVARVVRPRVAPFRGATAAFPRANAPARCASIVVVVVVVDWRRRRATSRGDDARGGHVVWANSPTSASRSVGRPRAARPRARVDRTRRRGVATSTSAATGARARRASSIAPRRATRESATARRATRARRLDSTAATRRSRDDADSRRRATRARRDARGRARSVSSVDRGTRASSTTRAARAGRGDARARRSLCARESTVREPGEGTRDSRRGFGADSAPIRCRHGDAARGVDAGARRDAREREQRDCGAENAGIDEDER